MQTLSRILHICCTFFHITTICIFNLSFLEKFQVALLTKFSLSGKDQLRSQGTILIQFCSLGVEKNSVRFFQFSSTDRMPWATGQKEVIPTS